MSSCAGYRPYSTYIQAFNVPFNKCMKTGLRYLVFENGKYIILFIVNMQETMQELTNGRENEITAGAGPYLPVSGRLRIFVKT